MLINLFLSNGTLYKLLFFAFHCLTSLRNFRNETRIHQLDTISENQFRRQIIFNLVIFNQINFTWDLWAWYISSINNVHFFFFNWKYVCVTVLTISNDKLIKKESLILLNLTIMISSLENKSNHVTLFSGYWSKKKKTRIQSIKDRRVHGCLENVEVMDWQTVFIPSRTCIYPRAMFDRHPLVST